MTILRLLASLTAAAVLYGHAAEIKTTTLDVKGMTCSLCPVTVKLVLQKRAGVRDVKMDSERHTAEVKFDPSLVSPEKLAAAVTEAGYPATPRK